MFPCPICRKKQFDSKWFYFSFYLFFCLNVITICKSMILHNTHMIFASILLASDLFLTYHCFLFFHHVQKPLKFINNVLQTNESFPSESNLLVFSLSLHSFWAIGLENVQTIST